MTRTRLRESWVNRGASEAELGWIDTVLDPDILTIGFARRVPSYKRLTLMLRDQDRLKALLTDPDRPVQLVVAGKAHPADDGGKGLIQQLVRFADQRACHRIVFLPDYEIAAGPSAGCDVWLNNLIRLLSKGTSQKAAQRRPQPVDPRRPGTVVYARTAGPSPRPTASTTLTAVRH